MPPLVAPAVPDWRRAYGGAPATGRVRAAPEDFFVDEVLGFTPDGDGEHCLVRVEKRDANSAWIAGRLARHAGVPVRDVGYAGMKDRFAVTRQWFSIGLAGRPEPDWEALADGTLRILEVARHRRKLRRGVHAGNRFALRVHDVDGDRERLAAVLDGIARHGFPNYFGPQRFGRDGGNLAGAAAFLANPRRRLDRRRRGLYLSAARALLFNTVLDRRVADGSWTVALPGEAVMLDGRRSLFVVERPDAALTARVASLELHPSGPLWGVEGPSLGAPARTVEARALAGLHDWCTALETLRVAAARRPLRVRAGELAWALSGRTCELAFFLPSGSFATALLREGFLERGAPPPAAGARA